MRTTTKQRLPAGKDSVTLNCPAKINLSLRILDRYADGYHALQSLMVKLSLFDRLTIRPLASDDIRFSCPGHPELENDNNLVLRAVHKLLPRGVGVDVVLDKQIPMGAGLGGGSSDAASTILAMNQLFGLELTLAEQVELAVSLGSDVPLFLYKEPAAWVSGRGDKILPLPNFIPLALLLVFPGFSVSTAWAYQAYDDQLAKSNKHPKTSQVVSDQKILTLSSRNDKENWNRPVLESLNDIASIMVNDLEGVVVERHNTIKELKAKLKAAGAKETMMSGSGSSVFAIFEDIASAQAARQRLHLSEQAWCRAVTALSIDGEGLGGE